jgi:dihydrofolate reductase
VSEAVRIVFVVAAAANGVIGRDGQLPWRLPSDLKRFRALTLGKPVIMGRKTYESIGKPLDGRDNIILSRQPAFSPPGVAVVAKIEDAIQLGRRLAAQRGVDEMAIIGGAEVFRAALPLTDRVYLTLVKGTPVGETRLPKFDPETWQETAREAMAKGPRDQYCADFIVLDRKKS